MNYVLNDKYVDINGLYNSFRKSGFKLDLGCGYYKPEGFIGLDNLAGKDSQIPSADNSPDILINLETETLPFPDNSVDEIRSSHFLEHSNLMHIFNESFRVLKPGHIFLFAVPYANSAEGMYPGHSIFLTEKWFYNNLVFQKYFTIVKEEYKPSEYYLSLPYLFRIFLPFSFARKFLFNACCEMTFTCLKK